MWFTIFFTASFRSYVFAIWNICIVRNPEIAESQNYEWTAEGKIQWDEGILPHNSSIQGSKELDDQEV